MQMRKKPDKLENLRGQIKAGLDALERGEFTEIADADLERYLNDLVSPREAKPNR
jgi:antitoxin ParD1/3/4